MGEVINLKVRVQEPDECVWVESSKRTWRTSCGETIEDMDFTPEEMGMKFCAYCGKKLMSEEHPERLA